MNTATPGTDPLAELRPLHLPQDSLWWPPAPGWWLLGILLLLLVWLGIRWWMKNRIKRVAIKELDQLQQQQLTAPDYASGLSQLLKRYCLTQFPREEIAGLTGEQWHQFLDQHSPEPHPQLGTVLAETPYQREGESIDYDALYREAKRWIRHNPPRRKR